MAKQQFTSIYSMNKKDQQVVLSGYGHWDNASTQVGLISTVGLISWHRDEHRDEQRPNAKEQRKVNLTDSK